MGFLRFRRFVKVLPGLRLNFGKRGVSVSVGPRGAKLTAGRTGIRQTVGLPGSGLSYTTVTSFGRRNPARPGFWASVRNSFRAPPGAPATLTPSAPSAGSPEDRPSCEHVSPAIPAQFWNDLRKNRADGWFVVCCAELLRTGGDAARQGIAAVALFDEPYGFTWEMIEVLMAAMDRATDLPPREFALALGAIERVAALLPPRETPSDEPRRLE